MFTRVLGREFRTLVSASQTGPLPPASLPPHSQDFRFRCQFCPLLSSLPRHLHTQVSLQPQFSQGATHPFPFKVGSAVRLPSGGQQRHPLTQEARSASEGSPQKFCKAPPRAHHTPIPPLLPSTCCRSSQLDTQLCLAPSRLLSCSTPIHSVLQQEQSFKKRRPEYQFPAQKPPRALNWLRAQRCLQLYLWGTQGVSSTVHSSHVHFHISFLKAGLVIILILRMDRTDTHSTKSPPFWPQPHYSPRRLVLHFCEPSPRDTPAVMCIVRTTRSALITCRPVSLSNYVPRHLSLYAQHPAQGWAHS